MVAGTTIAAGPGVTAGEIFDESVEGVLAESGSVFLVESTGAGILVESGFVRMAESVVGGILVESIAVETLFIEEDVSALDVVVSVPVVGLSVALYGVLQAAKAIKVAATKKILRFISQFFL